MCEASPLFTWALMTNTCWNPHVRINIFGVRFESLGEAERSPRPPQHKPRWTPLFNTPLPSSKNPHFQNEAKCTTFLVKMSFICMRMKCYFHIKVRGPGELGNGLLLRLRRNRLFDLLRNGGRGLGGRLWYFVFLSLLLRWKYFPKFLV